MWPTTALPMLPFLLLLPRLWAKMQGQGAARSGLGTSSYCIEKQVGLPPGREEEEANPCSLASAGGSHPKPLGKESGEGDREQIQYCSVHPQPRLLSILIQKMVGNGNAGRWAGTLRGCKLPIAEDRKGGEGR